MSDINFNLKVRAYDPNHGPLIAAGEVQEVLDSMQQELNNRLQWISVDDRLPELDQDVLSVDKSGRVYNSTWRGNHFKCVGLVWEHDNVTHWMPFPEPPTQEQGE